MIAGPIDQFVHAHVHTMHGPFT